MTTKEGVRQALKAIGLYGLAGETVAGSNQFNAFMELIGDSDMDNSLAQKVFNELKRQHLIHITPNPQGFRIGVTPKGGLKLLQIQANEVTIPPMKQWDNMWRMVCFDIPQEKNSERLYLNRRLHELNFTMLQRSMWIHPYDCIEQIRVITDYVNLTRYVSVLEVTKLDEQSTRRLHKIYDVLLIDS